MLNLRIDIGYPNLTARSTRMFLFTRSKAFEISHITSATWSPSFRAVDALTAYLHTMSPGARPALLFNSASVMAFAAQSRTRRWAHLDQSRKPDLKCNIGRLSPSGLGIKHTSKLLCSVGQRPVCSHNPKIYPSADRASSDKPAYCLGCHPSIFVVRSLKVLDTFRIKSAVINSGLGHG